ncbi:MAG: phenylalanine 4-monooxygenase [Pseudomonadota bacterium]
MTSYRAKIPGPDGSITYTPGEHAVWRDLMARQRPNVDRHMSRVFLDGLAKLNLSEVRVPRITEIRAALGAATGWSVEPVPALIPETEFFRLLAGCRFPAASFIRRREHFDYIEEPDIFHEIFGHAPLLADPRFAAFSRHIGKTGLDAPADIHGDLIRLYWFAIEFGLTTEDGVTKALGAGLASSPTELPWSVLAPEVERRAFVLRDVLRTPYRIDIKQPVYYVIEDLDALFDLAEIDLATEIAAARAKGMFAPNFPLIAAE